MHLYYLFPSLEEGGLATYRTAIVQNQHLAMLAKVSTVGGGGGEGPTGEPVGGHVLVFSPAVTTPLPSKGARGKSVTPPLPRFCPFFSPPQVCNWS